MSKIIKTRSAGYAMGYAANSQRESVFQAIMHLISEGRQQEAENLARQLKNRHGENNATYTRVPQLRR